MTNLQFTIVPRIGMVYTRAKNEIDQLKTSGASEDELYQVWEDRNNKLRSMGIKLVAFPE